MVKYGILGTVQEAKRTSNEEKITSNINYIFIDYNEIDDSLIDLNEKEKDCFTTNTLMKKCGNKDRT